MKVLYVKNGSERNKKFQLQTMIYEEDGKRFVKKSALCDEALPHLQSMENNYYKLSQSIINPKVKLAKIVECDERSLTFEYIEGESLAKRFSKIENDEQKIEKLVKEHESFLLSSFKTTIFDACMITNECREVFGDIDYSQFDGEVCFDGISNVDLIFSNIIYRDDEIYIIDYEWVFACSLPIEYVVYRSLHSKRLLGKFEKLKIYDNIENHFIFKYVCNKSYYTFQSFYSKQRLSVEGVISQKEQQLHEKEEQNRQLRDLLLQKEQQLHEKDQKIHEILDFAESMRLKNRMKSLLKKSIPVYKNNLKEIGKKVIVNTVGMNSYTQLKNFYHHKKMNISASDKLIREIDMEKEKVLYLFPVIDWGFRVQRPQHLCKEARNSGYQVIYFSIAFHTNKEPGYYIKSLEQNIWNVTLFLDESKNIYTEKLSEANIRFILNGIAKLEKDLFITNRISIIDHPFWFQVANNLSGAFTIYDCMDYHEGFGDNSQYLIELEKIAMEQSDLLILSSQDLFNRFSEKNKNTVLVRNGCEFNYFNKRPAKVELIDEKKKIGYYGAISSWFDTELVIELARHYPNYDFILIGALHGCENIQGLKDQKNIILVGEIPYDRLTSYLYAFDVCIMPFKINELTYATNPVKIYEYLAAGKPVVSTKLPEVELMGDVVYTASNTDEFIAKIDEAINQNSVEKEIVRKEFSKSNDWSSRYKKIEKKIVEIKKNRPKVSIVIVTYNNLDFTKNCLESMERFNNYENSEVIIVDNLSNDGTREYLAEYAKNRDNFRVILHSENSGFAGGNNIGIRAASGDYIILLNNDTYVTPNWIHNLLRHFNDKKIAMVGPRTNNIGNEAKLEITYKNLDEMILKSYEIYYGNILKQYEIDVLAFFCVAIKKEIIDEIGLLDEIYGIGMFEDDDYCMRVKNAGYKLICADDVFIHHHLGASFNKNPEWKEKLFRKNKAIFENRYGEWIPHKYRNQ